MKRTIVLLLVLVVNVGAVRMKNILSEEYGVENGMCMYVDYGNEDEESAVPRTFYVDGKSLIVDDCNKNMLTIWDGNKQLWKNVRRKYCIDIKYVDLYKSILIDWVTINNINSNDSLITIYSFKNKKGDIVQNIFEHPSGYKIITTSGKRFYFNKNYKQIQRTELPDYIQEIDLAVYFKDKKAILTSYFDGMRKYVTEFYNELSDTNKATPPTSLFRLPDSSEQGNYFNDSTDLEYLGYDSLYNTYWLSNSIYYRNVDSTFNSNGTIYQDFVNVLFSYDRLGRLRYWFPEPALEAGWKRYSGGIIVNREGRIFQMNYYSLRGKKTDQIDKSKGIGIVEYIPEEKDFSHEERVKMYGKKNK